MALIEITRLSTLRRVCILAVSIMVMQYAMRNRILKGLSGIMCRLFFLRVA